MQARAGVIGGAIGGIIKLIIDYLTYAVGISSVDSIGDFSQVLFRIKQMNVAICIVYLIAAGAAGWFISSLISDSKRFVTWGIVFGILFWALMNVILIASTIVTPTWSMGVGSFISDLISHIIWGLSVTFTIQFFNKKKEKAKS
jgi:uncharacterized membrane protein YagU involved in acid resistance